jgi:hypothetical protein
MGLLTVSVLESLPIEEIHFGPDNIFAPIVRAVLNQLETKELLPASDGSFVSARNAKFARGSELRDLIDYQQLNSLYETKNLKWLSKDFSQNDEDPLHKYLSDRLNIKPIEAIDFCRQAVNTSFFEKQKEDIKWFQNFYLFLDDRKALWRKQDGFLRYRPFVLLENDSIVAPYAQDETPNAYICLESNSDYPTIKRVLFEKSEVEDFFVKRLEISMPNICDDVINKTFPKYQSNKQITDKEHNLDMQKIIEALQTDSESKKKKMLDVAKETSFIKVIDNNAIYSFKSPKDIIYFNSPELHDYFAGLNDIFFLAESDRADFEYSIFGIRSLPAIMYASKAQSSYQQRKEGTDDYDLHGLKNFFETFNALGGFLQKKQKALNLWNFLKEHLEKDRNFLFGIKYWFYYSQRWECIKSTMLNALQSQSWIPTKEDMIVSPLETSISHLCDELQQDINLIQILEIPEKDKTELEIELEKAEEARKNQLAESLGVKQDDIKAITDNREEFEKWKSRMQQRNLNNEVADNVSSNPERRDLRVKEIAEEENNRTKVVKERTVSITGDEKERAKAYLLYNYRDSDPDKIMRCQICGSASEDIKESPFRTQDGEWHFEVYPLFNSLRDKLHTQNYLALCHNHAAMFRLIGDSELSKIKDAILYRKQNDERYIEVSILGKQRRIWFTTDHINDLKSLLEQKQAKGEAG